MSTDILLGVAGIAGMGVVGYFMYEALGAKPDPATDSGDEPLPPPANCTDNTVWDAASQLCKVKAAPANPVTNPVTPSPDSATDSGNTFTPKSAALAATEQNYLNYINDIQEFHSGDADSNGCFNSQYTMRNSDGKLILAKLCPDAEGCYQNLIAGATGGYQFGDWGKQVDSGLATCGVLGGKQAGTVTLMNAKQITDWHNTYVSEDQELGAGVLAGMDYNSYGVPVSWNDFTLNSVVYDVSHADQGVGFKPMTALTPAGPSDAPPPPAQPPAPTRNNTGAGYRKGFLPNGVACESNSDCACGACARGTADSGAGMVCCPSGDYMTYGGYTYCTKMSVGTTCWSDSMCGSGYCKGNCGGMCRGTCEQDT